MSMPYVLTASFATAACHARHCDVWPNHVVHPPDRAVMMIPLSMMDWLRLISNSSMLDFV